ncbi:MAG: shikimate kinase, partial [Flavobacteriales bacterium]
PAAVGAGSPLCSTLKTRSAIVFQQPVTRHVVLIGMMCSGKSTVGRALAPLLGLPFIDLDREIEGRTGALLPFVQREGEAAFRAVEAEVLAEVLAREASVIAAGGGTPAVPGNLELLQRSATLAWLDVPLEALMPRIELAGGDRPLLHGLKGEALRARVKALLDERRAAYGSATIRVDADAPPAIVAQRLAAALRDQLR